LQLAKLIILKDNSWLFSSYCFSLNIEISHILPIKMNFKLKQSKYFCDPIIGNLLIEPDELKLFPNPSQDVLNISLSQGFGMVLCLDSKGFVVHSQEIETGKTAINVSAFTAGVYFIRYAGTIWKFIKL
jgi:hypothetical protein